MKKVIIFLLLFTFVSLFAGWEYEIVSNKFASSILHKTLSPDKSKFVFYMEDSGYRLLSCFDIETEEITNLAILGSINNGYLIYPPSWSGDSKKVLYQNAVDEWKIYDFETQNTEPFDDAIQMAYNCDGSKICKLSQGNWLYVSDSENINFTPCYALSNMETYYFDWSINDNNKLYVTQYRDNGLAFIHSYDTITDSYTTATDSLQVGSSNSYFWTPGLAFVGYVEDNIEKLIYTNKDEDLVHQNVYLYQIEERDVELLTQISFWWGSIDRVSINDALDKLTFTGFHAVGLSDFWGNGCIYSFENDNIDYLLEEPFGSNQQTSTAITLTDLLYFNDNTIYMTVTDMNFYWSGNPNRFDIAKLTYETSISETTPKSAQLYQNYPNPFNPTTTIGYNLERSSDVKLNVYDVTGSLVKELNLGTKQAGHFITNFDGNNLSAGIYYYSLILDGVVSDTKKMILVK